LRHRKLPHLKIFWDYQVINKNLEEFEQFPYEVDGILCSRFRQYTKFFNSKKPAATNLLNPIRHANQCIFKKKEFNKKLCFS
jgi:hypothetical protein